MFKVQLAASVWMMVAVGCASSQGGGEEKGGSEEKGVSEEETEPVDPAEADTEPLDTDGDGLSDEDEAIARTDSQNPDTDGDGLEDGDEVYTLGTDPTEADTDDDGLSDGHEIEESGTDPLVPDTDGDGLSDGHEVERSGSDPLVTDTDGDHLSDGEEVEFGSDPVAKDSDDDGYSDWSEERDGSDPNSGLSMPRKAAADEWVPCFTLTMETGNHLAPALYPEGTYVDGVGGPECACTLYVVSPVEVTVGGVSVQARLGDFGGDDWAVSRLPAAVSLEVPWAAEAGLDAEIDSETAFSSATSRTGERLPHWVAFSDAMESFDVVKSEGPIDIAGTYKVYISMVSTAGEDAWTCPTIRSGAPVGTDDLNYGVFMRLESAAE